MKTFNDYEGIEGIDKLVESSSYIYAILTDKEVMSLLDNEHNWIEFGGAVIKAHEKEAYKIMEILGEKPMNPLSAVSSISKIMFEVISNKDMLDFFTSLPTEKKSATSVTENTEGKQ